jgi:anti-sigma-K factor RskA
VNIQEYISSGIVESYVLGLASAEEQLEFERLCTAHPEIKAAKEAFESSLEQHALDSAVAPPSNLKQKIWSDLNLQPEGRISNLKIVNDKAEPLTPVRSMSFARMLTAASIILLIGSAMLNIYYYNQYKSSTAKLNELIAANEGFAKNNNVLQAKLQQYENSFELMKDPSKAIVVAMKGQAIAPSSETTVYWEKQTKDVYLLINNLPQPAANKQYQLWAIVDGKPVDAGVFDMNTSNALVKMRNIPNAQAFAITLEKAGGSTAPNLQALYVMGKI